MWLYDLESSHALSSTQGKRTASALWGSYSPGPRRLSTTMPGRFANLTKLGAPLSCVALTALDAHSEQSQRRPHLQGPSSSGRESKSTSAASAAAFFACFSSDFIFLSASLWDLMRFARALASLVFSVTSASFSRRSCPRLHVKSPSVARAKSSLLRTLCASALRVRPSAFAFTSASASAKSLDCLASRARTCPAPFSTRLTSASSFAANFCASINFFIAPASSPASSALCTLKSSLVMEATAAGTPTSSSRYSSSCPCSSTSSAALTPSAMFFSASVISE
mmetsp:Transcript_57984/g.109239  ORF Transcript_57984/g.109239 Transcript_57984/m.109239 type:complete len:281 (+) Transcript_57984:1119-1961(+)